MMKFTYAKYVVPFLICYQFQYTVSNATVTREPIPENSSSRTNKTTTECNTTVKPFVTRKHMTNLERMCRYPPGVNKSTYSLEQYPELFIYRFFRDHVYRILFPLGFVFNGLTLGVVAPRVTSSPAYFNMGTLAVWDTASLLLRLIETELFVARVQRSKWSCRFHTTILSFTEILAVWTMVIMTFDRFIIVLFPMKASTFHGMQKLRTCLIYIFVCTIIGLLVSRLMFITYGLLGRCFTLPAYDYQWLPIVDTLMLFFLPWCLVYLMNIVIVITVRKATRVHRSLTGTNPGHIKREKQIAMLLTVSCVFLMLIGPNSIAFLLHDASYKKCDVYIREQLADILFKALYDFNHVVNLFIFCLYGSVLRSDIGRLLRWKGLGNSPASSPASSSATS